MSDDGEENWMGAPAVLSSDPTIAALQAAHAHGRWGFTTPIGNGSTGVLLTSEMRPWFARSWVVTLNAWKYQGGAIAQPTMPPVNSITLTQLRLRVEWGVDGASESCLIDYPWSGCSFVLHAASIRIYIDNTASLGSGGATLPIIGGFLAPSTAAYSKTREVPTFTTAPRLFSFLAPTKIPLPARARAYRFVPFDEVARGGIKTITQNCASGVESIDYSQGQAANIELTWRDRMLWVPICNDTEWLEFQPGQDQNASFEFLIDLG